MNNASMMTSPEEFAPLDRPNVVPAIQWFKNGDHPRDESHYIFPDDGEPFLAEGKLVRRFLHPGIAGDTLCDLCERPYHEHGFLDIYGLTQGEATVCPGDWIVEVTPDAFTVLRAVPHEQAAGLVAQHRDSTSVVVQNDPMG